MEILQVEDIVKTKNIPVMDLEYLKHKVIFENNQLTEFALIAIDANRKPQNILISLKRNRSVIRLPDLLLLHALNPRIYPQKYCHRKQDNHEDLRIPHIWAFKVSINTSIRA